MDSNKYATTVNTMLFNENNGSDTLAVAGWACATGAGEWQNDGAPRCSLDPNGINQTAPQGVFAPLYLGGISLNGSFSGSMFGSGWGDRIDSMIQLSNGDFLIGGSFCWVSNPANGDVCFMNYSGFNVEPIVNDDAFVIRMDSNGTWLWGVTVGAGNSWDIVTDFAETPNGDIYAMISYCNQGGSNCEIQAEGLPYSNESQGGEELLLVKINSMGTIQWARNMGSPTDDSSMNQDWWPLRERGMIATNDGGVIVSGSGCEGSGSGCSFQFDNNTNFTGHNSFVAKYDSNGEIQWFEEINAQFLQTMSMIDNNTLLVAGNYFEPTLTLGTHSITHSNPSESDGWWAIFNHSSRTWKGLWGSTETDDLYIHSSAVGPKGEIILGASACWSVTPCSIQIANQSASGLSFGTGILVKLNHSSDDEWMMLVNYTGAESPINNLVVSSKGDIGFSAPYCKRQSTTCHMYIDGLPLSQQADSANLVVRIMQDSDRDGIYYSQDSCPTGFTYWTSNATTDVDGDGCRDIDEDNDDDGDGTLDDDDDCPILWGNSTQDRIGCLDSDGDGWSDSDMNWNNANGADAYPFDPLQWVDTDGDGYGDNHYYDIDPTTGLFVNQTGDGSPNDPEQWEDMDGDGYGDNDQNGARYDDCPTITGTSNQNGKYGCIDTDGDGWANDEDDFPLNSTQWADRDGDGYGDNPLGEGPDACPDDAGQSTGIGNLGCPDIDGDNWPDDVDAFPNDSSQWNDTDEDGYGDEPDGTDGDDCPTTWGNSSVGGKLGCVDSDGDGYADSIDELPDEDTQWVDFDNDGYGDNPDGVDPDGCPTIPGTSYLDVLGCSDFDSDGWSGNTDAFPFNASQWSDIDEDGYGDNLQGADPNLIDNCIELSNPDQSDYDGDGAGDVCDDDSDDDGVANDLDQCPNGVLDWTSTTTEDYDSDGCLDNAQEDLDDDNDGVPDDEDQCTSPNGEIGWNSSDRELDYDRDGCNDEIEDNDDDNDGVIDNDDDCSKGSKNWVSRSQPPATDHDSDGCRDGSEDEDDDNDGVLDTFDACPVGYVNWEAVTSNGNPGPNDLNPSDGCVDGAESPGNEGSGTANDQFLLDLINQNNEEETFVEALASGDLDAIGIVFTILFAFVSITGTVLIRARKSAFIRGLERSIMTAVDLEDLDQAKKNIRRAMKKEKISSNRYGLMMDELKEKKLELQSGGSPEETKGPPSKAREKGPPSKTREKGPPSRTPPKTSPEPEPVIEEANEEEEFESILSKITPSDWEPPADEVTTGGDGYSYWEDQNGQWWVQMPDGEWTEWND